MNKMKEKKNTTLPGTVSKYNRKIVERGKSIPASHINIFQDI
jgi:hypothetical protein